MPINFVRNPLLNPHEIKHTCLLLYSPLKIPDIDTQIQKLTHTYIQNGEREVRERERELITLWEKEEGADGFYLICVEQVQ